MLDLAGLLTCERQKRAGGWGKQGSAFNFCWGQTARILSLTRRLFDFIALGDGEELLPEIGLVLEEGKLSGLTEQLLLDLAYIPGVYVPQDDMAGWLCPSESPMYKADSQTVPHASLLDWVGTVRGDGA